ncbi:AT-rich interactive domain-containing protein 3A [Choloepus didactylus]|uniref:AT-rich interactive domain-containing protein 3A n=1 Tax=Choloepus didactylus TaxID=27675 RepID=UPI00189F1C7D|nr:AT-rich interactive domain-containing protein 3A [Choloepus didactylus]
MLGAGCVSACLGSGGAEGPPLARLCLWKRLGEGPPGGLTPRRGGWTLEPPGWRAGAGAHAVAGGKGLRGPGGAAPWSRRHPGPPGAFREPGVIARAGRPGREWVPPLPGSRGCQPGTPVTPAPGAAPLRRREPERVSLPVGAELETGPHLPPPPQRPPRAQGPRGFVSPSNRGSLCVTAVNGAPAPGPPTPGLLGKPPGARGGQWCKGLCGKLRQDQPQPEPLSLIISAGSVPTRGSPCTQAEALPPQWRSCRGCSVSSGAKAAGGSYGLAPAAVPRFPHLHIGAVFREWVPGAARGPCGSAGEGAGASSTLCAPADRHPSAPQLYELDGDPKRKEFLDDLFSFMQKRGTPVNRIPIMAKQVLDLFMLYVLVTEKGGLVEVINKKLWREITKGLNLPTSITSAAFTLRTQYMKYLYPYECEKRGLSNPNELQAAIDSNRREGRRQSFGGSLFAYSPGGAHGLLSSPKLPSLGLAASTNGSSITPAPKIKKEEDPAIPIAVPGRLPVSLAGHPVVAAQAAAVQAAAAQAAVAAQAAALEHFREKLESGEPPEKKMALVTDEQQRLMQRALQQNFLAMTAQLPMSIRINSQASEGRQDAAVSVSSSNGSHSISMSVEINGIVYTGVLFAQPPAPTPPSAPGKGGDSSRGRNGGTSSGAGGQAGPSAPPTSSTSNNSLP